MPGWLATNRRLRREYAALRLENTALRRELSWASEQTRADQADLALLRAQLADEHPSPGRHAAAPPAARHPYFAHDDDETQVIPFTPLPAARPAIE